MFHESFNPTMTGMKFNQIKMLAWRSGSSSRSRYYSSVPFVFLHIFLTIIWCELIIRLDENVLGLTGLSDVADILGDLVKEGALSPSALHRSPSVTRTRRCDLISKDANKYFKHVERRLFYEAKTHGQLSEKCVFVEQQARGAAEESHDGGGEEGAEDVDEEEAAREAGGVPQTEGGEEREGACPFHSS